MEERKRLLFVVNNPAFFLTHRLPIALAAQAAGYEVHVATPDGSGLGLIRSSGFTHHVVPMDRSRGRIWRELATLFSLVRLYRALKPRVVHHVTIKPVLYGTLAARLSRVPAVVNAISGLGYIFISPGAKAFLVRCFIEAAYRFSLRHPRQRIIFQNPDDRDYFVRRGMARASDTVLIKGSGADTSVFKPSPEPEGDLLVLLASRMLWDKGVGEYVSAARLLRKDHARTRFVLVGSTDPGNPSSVPEPWLREAQAEGAVEWWGNRDHMERVLNQAHIVCLPSYREGLPKILIEAAACGRPIVATDAPGCREIVRHGENGLLVPLRDEIRLAEALGTLLCQPLLRRKLGMRGREMVESEFGLDTVVEQTVDLYRQLDGMPLAVETGKA